MTNPGKLQDQILASEAYRIFLRLEAMKRSYFMFQGNFLDLKKLLDRLYEPEIFLPLMAVDKRQQLMTILLDLSRRLNNFVSSACMSVEHTERMIPSWYARDEVIITEYNRRNHADFTANNLHAFITGLRNFTLHEELPVIRTHVRATRQSTSDSFLEWAFGLDRTALERYEGWNAKARAFMASYPESINIRLVVENYYRLVTEFHNWLQTTLDTHHRTELAWLEDMDGRLQEALKSLM